MTQASRKSRRAVLGAPLRRQSFRMLFIGQVVSRTGDVILHVGLAAYALQHGRPGLLAYCLLAQSCGTVAMLLFGGALADRIGARRSLVLADTARVLAVVVATALVAGNVVDVVPLAACTLLLGLGDGAFEPAFTVAFMELLPGEELLAANSLQSVALRFASLGGAALGGAVVAFGSTAVPMALDALTFLISLGCVVFARRWQRRERDAAPSGMLLSIVEGARYVRRQRWLLFAIIGFGISVAFVFTPSRALVPLVAQRLTANGGTAYSVLVAAQGVGALVGGLVLGARREPRRAGVFIFVMMVTTNLGFTVVALSPSLVASAAAMLVGGAAIAAASVAWASLMQRNVPADMIGRVSSFDWLITVGATPLALAFVPELLNRWPADAILLTASLIGAATSLLALLVRDLRAVTWRTRDEPRLVELIEG